ncbi:MAG: ABC transporter ATP-binding protein [SAR324 cluster bacterium]|uniref:ABC transporter ATP-binding protein n=1 Tax=SAR324 cluster bacterium TaxID=2024889 RepID=A0A7X9FRW1_9DELT|nr:ABC transporter ATP-binding protein [SAR324 cluster bacterium]
MIHEASDNAPILEISDLHYSYTSDWLWRKVPALHGVSIEVQQGEAFGFLGPNGAGKTTTIKCILGLIKPSSGKISIAGKPNTSPESRRELAYLPEQPYFYDHLTPYELVKMYALLSGVQGRNIKRAVQEALEKVDVAPRSRVPLRSLSKGLMQRVGMAQAIVAKPKLLILDEPFSGLDPIGRMQFRNLLIDLKNEGTSIFMSSHILSDVEFVCDRASILINGELKGIIDLKDLPNNRAGSVSFTVSNYKDAEDALRVSAMKVTTQGPLLTATFPERSLAEHALLAALGSGASLESFDYDVASLEEVFMDLVNKSKHEGFTL